MSTNKRTCEKMSKVQDYHNNNNNDNENDNNKIYKINNIRKNPVIPNKKQKTKSDDEDDEELKFLFSLLVPNKQILNKGKNKTQPVNTTIILHPLQCNNPNCNHKTIEEDPTLIEKYKVKDIKNIEDLIKLGKTYHCKKNIENYGLNLRILCNLVTPLTELKNMVGLGNVKSHIVDQILFFLRGYNKNNKCNMCVDCSYNLPCAKNLDDMLHTVITGPPGVGKTQMGKILAKVYKEMGILSKGHFKLVTRSDLIAKYLGQTAVKTQEVIDECMGGVMFIDEAYSLGHSEGRDSFSKECLDTLNQNLSEKRDFLCIIAGYKDELDKCFFSMNDGLKRRFTFRYDIEGYSSCELLDIFVSKIEMGGWKTDFNTNNTESTENREEMEKFFEENKNNFPNYGGDIETLFLNSKIAHCRKIKFDEPSQVSSTTEHDSIQENESSNEIKKITVNTVNKVNFNERILTVEDIKDGMDMYLSSRQYVSFDIPPSIYI